MALDVTLTTSTGPLTYRLKAEKVTIMYDRAPIQVPVPSNINPLLYDFGQFRPSLIIEGVVDEAASSEGGVTIPSKNNLEDALRNWWNTTITASISGDSYVSKVATFRFEIMSGQEDRWHYSIRLVTLGRS